jgi:hypothetical protein
MRQVQGIPTFSTLAHSSLQLKGLCGNYNDNTGDDTTTAAGVNTKNTTMFVSGWKMTECSSLSISEDFQGQCAFNLEKENMANSLCNTLASGKIVYILPISSSVLTFSL